MGEPMSDHNCDEHWRIVRTMRDGLLDFDAECEVCGRTEAPEEVNHTIAGLRDALRFYQRGTCADGPGMIRDAAVNILAFDLSTTHIGWARIDDDANYLAHGEATLRGNFAARMIAALEVLDATCQTVSAAARVAVESPFVGKNSKTALQLGLLRGMLWALTIQRLGSVPIEITPAEAKQALTGHGAADKAAMLYFARVRCGVYLPEHAADAYGVALAAWGQMREVQMKGCGE